MEQNSLFVDYEEEQQEPKNIYQPLSERMRPTKLSEYVGQKHLDLLWKMIENDQITSMIFWGRILSDNG